MGSSIRPSDAPSLEELWDEISRWKDRALKAEAAQGELREALIAAKRALEIVVPSGEHGRQVKAEAIVTIDAALVSPSAEAAQPVAEPVEWLWFGEAGGEQHISFGRWQNHKSQYRYKYADIQATEHDHHAQPQGEAAQPVAWQWRFTEKGYDEWKNGRTPVNPYATFGSSWSGEIMKTEERPLYALSQPQGELREALERVTALEKALEPFEEVADEGSEDQPDDTPCTIQAGRSTCYGYTLKQFRAIRALLSAKGGETP